MAVLVLSGSLCSARVLLWLSQQTAEKHLSLQQEWTENTICSYFSSRRAHLNLISPISIVSWGKRDLECIFQHLHVKKEQDLAHQPAQVPTLALVSAQGTWNLG